MSENKIILQLNEVQNNLKLIKVNDGFVVVDLNSKILNGDWFINGKSIVKAHSNVGEEWQTDEFVHGVSNLTNINYSFEKEKCYKIIFATQNINLDRALEIEEKDEIVKAIQTITTWSSFKDHPIGKAGEKIENWYKKSRKNLFTEEDLLDAWELGAKEGLPLTRKKKEHLFQSLKQPKVEISFNENNIPVKCVML